MKRLTAWESWSLLGGALVAVLRNRAEIVLADVNRQPPKSAARPFPVGSHSLGRRRLRSPTCRFRFTFTCCGIRPGMPWRRKEWIHAGCNTFLGMPASPTRYATPPCRRNRSRTCGRARRIRPQNAADARKGRPYLGGACAKRHLDEARRQKTLEGNLLKERTRPSGNCRRLCPLQANPWP